MDVEVVHKTLQETVAPAAACKDVQGRLARHGIGAAHAVTVRPWLVNRGNM